MPAFVATRHTHHKPHMAAPGSADGHDDDSPGADRSRLNPGLCGRCVHASRIISSRGSVFFLCGLSAVDPVYPKYPRLPVIRCDGFRDRGEDMR
jgi:hypothetical protein